MARTGIDIVTRALDATQAGFSSVLGSLRRLEGAAGETGKKAGDAYTNLEKLISTLSTMASMNCGMVWNSSVTRISSLKCDQPNSLHAVERI